MRHLRFEIGDLTFESASNRTGTNLSLNRHGSQAKGTEQTGKIMEKEKERERERERQREREREREREMLRELKSLIPLILSAI